MLRMLLCYDLVRNLYVLVILYSMIICVGCLDMRQNGLQIFSILVCW